LYALTSIKRTTHLIQLLTHPLTSPQLNPLIKLSLLHSLTHTYPTNTHTLSFSPPSLL
jgi:hypothetical protein